MMPGTGHAEGQGKLTLLLAVFQARLTLDSSAFSELTPEHSTAPGHVFNCGRWCTGIPEF
jgi:hypothetical protein